MLEKIEGRKQGVAIGLVSGIAGFAIGFLQYGAEMIVYRDSRYFVAGIINGLWLFPIFFVFGYLAWWWGERIRAQRRSADEARFAPVKHEPVSSNDLREKFDTIFSNDSSE